jgi:hypothetical protein
LTLADFYGPWSFTLFILSDDPSTIVHNIHGASP